MYCGNCGNKIEGNINVCPKCNTPLYQDKSQSFAHNEKVRSGKDKLPGSISVALIIALVLFVLFLATVVYVYAFGGSINGSFDLYCEEPPIQTEMQSVTLNGTIKSSSDATLTLNGDVIETVNSNQKEKIWSKSVSLKTGENIFVVTLSDGNGRSKSRVLYIENQGNIIYPAGTVLNLTASGVYIRPTPNKSDKFVVMLWDKATDLVCLGEEATDAEGYLWFKVNTPSNGAGWVRQDLVKVK